MLLVGDSAITSFYLIYYSNQVHLGRKIQLIEAVSDYIRGTENNIIMMTEKMYVPISH